MEIYLRESVNVWMIETRRSFWIVAAIFLIAVIGYFWTQTKVFVQLFYVSALLILVSWLWTMFSTIGVVVRRSSRELRQELGKIFEERFEIVNQKALIRPWLEIVDESRLPGPGGSRVLSWVGKYESRNYSAYTALRKRGQIVLGPTSLYSGDPFGLFVYKRVFSGKRSLLVLPYMFDLRWFPFPPGLLPGGKAQRQRTLEVTPYASGVREYYPGDSLNRIHWPTTARRDRLMVKEFEKDPQADFWIFVDAYRKVHLELLDEERDDAENWTDRFWFWDKRKKFTLPPDTFEYSVSIAASICRYFIHKDAAVGFGIAAQKYAVISPDRGERQFNKILEMLAYAEPEGNLPLIGLLQSEVRNISRGSTVILITGAVDSSVVLSVEHLQRRSMQPIVIMIDPLTFGGELGADRLLPEMHRRKIPLAIVSNGDDLEKALEDGLVRY